jgi:hypothetical protein
VYARDALKLSEAAVDERSVRKRAPTRSVEPFDWLLLAAAVLVACVRAATSPGWGDYADDAGPGLNALAHGHVAGFFSHQPAMGALAQFARVPFVLLAGALGDSPDGIYSWGNLPCLLSVALLAAWAARIARRHGTGRLGQVLIVVVCMLNPLVTNTLQLGHPEDLLTSSLAVASLLALCDRRIALAAVCAGLAIATKQWAAVLVCPVLLVAERERIRAGLLMLGSAAVVTLPMVIANFGAFRYALNYISKAGTITTDINWLYPLTSQGRTRIIDIFGPPRPITTHTVPKLLVAVSHPAIVVVGVAIPCVIWLRCGRQLGARELLLSMTLVFLLRCTLDPESAAYYHLPLLLTVVALDARTGRRLPLASLAGFAGIFTVLDRFHDYLAPGAVNAIYVSTTLAVAALLIERLYSGPERGLDRLARGGERLAQLGGLASAGPS